MLFQQVNNNSVAITNTHAELASKIDNFNAIISHHSSQIKLLEDQNMILRAEIEGLKDINRQPSSEIKVSGIPSTCTVLIAEIAHNLLKYINADSAINDIFEIRPITPKTSTLNPDTSASTSTDQTNNLSTPLTSSFVIQFRSVCERDRVLRLKRIAKTINLENLIQNGGDVKVDVFEMLSPRVFKLYNLVKSNSTKLGFKFTWARGENVYVRKSEKSSIITITTEGDLSKMD